MDWKIPLADVTIDERERAAVDEVLKSRWLTMGSATRAFEEAFAGYLGVKHAIAVTNATAALHLAHLALGIGPGDEVIVPSLTFVATANSILYTGAVPVFADILGPNDLNVSPEDIRRRIGTRTRAITVVHYGGHLCDIHAVLTMAKESGVPVVEDAAHAPGANLDGRKAGTFGDVGCFSFFSNKNMTTGEGGMVVTNRDDLAERLKSMRSHGMTSLTWDRHQGHASSYDVVSLGYNYRLDEMRSALGRVQLERLEGQNLRRSRIVEIYKRELADVPGLSIPFLETRGRPAHYLFPILLDRADVRTGFMQRMKEAGIQTSIHYPPVHLFEYYRRRFNYKPGTLSVTEDICSREVSLPLYPSMDESKIFAVRDAIFNSGIS